MVARFAHFIIPIALISTIMLPQPLNFQENASDDGFDAFMAAGISGTFYLEKAGAGLSAAIDPDGNDWIAWELEGSPYQGFPNAVWSGIDENPRGYFHPQNSGTAGHSNVIEFQSGDSVIVACTSDDRAWETAYKFYPTHVTWEVRKKPKKGSYWVLYEGLPGGSWEMETDWWMTSESAKKNPCTAKHTKDIPYPEWIVFGDKDQDRVLFMLSHEDDDQEDVYFPLPNFTVFGFGRTGTSMPYRSTITEASRSFSIGFLETTNYDSIRVAMNNLLQGLPPIWK